MFDIVSPWGVLLVALAENPSHCITLFIIYSCRAGMPDRSFREAQSPSVTGKDSRFAW
jgi:hypothetical protein